MEDFVTVPSVVSETELSQMVDGNFENTSFPLSDWHRSMLETLNATTAMQLDKESTLKTVKLGFQCLLYMWFTIQPKLAPGSYCNATWDDFYCWPPAPNGVTVTRPCSVILWARYGDLAEQLEGHGSRVCLPNGTWLHGTWTNYTECADNWEKFLAEDEDEDRDLVVQVRYILFFGSIASFVCLVASLIIFYFFECLRCDRVTVHIHLMVALTLRCILLVIITEPFIFNRTNHYRDHDIICKSVLSINLYATVSSILWMFLQGVYLHGKLTTVFDKGTHFKIYYAVGWGLPLVLICVWATAMQLQYPVECWKDYSDHPFIWILLAPMIAALVTNFAFLCHIMFVLLCKVQRRTVSGDSTHFRRAVKATAVLFPLLGINNLLFLYNPGGQYKKYFVILNTVFQATQGMLVSFLYCFISSDVRDAVRRYCRRLKATRSARNTRCSSINRHNRFNRSSRFGNGNNSIALDEQKEKFKPTRYFRSTFKPGESSRSGHSQSPETMNNIMPNDTPSPISANGDHLTASLGACGSSIRSISVENRHEIIPLEDLRDLLEK